MSWKDEWNKGRRKTESENWRTKPKLISAEVLSSLGDVRFRQRSER